MNQEKLNNKFFNQTVKNLNSFEVSPKNKIRIEENLKKRKKLKDISQSLSFDEKNTNNKYDAFSSIQETHIENTLPLTYTPAIDRRDYKNYN